MADQGNVKTVLDSHNGNGPRTFFGAPEDDTIIHLEAELVTGHVGIVPAVIRYHPAVGYGCRVDNPEEVVKITGLAGAYHDYSPCHLFVPRNVGSGLHKAQNKSLISRNVKQIITRPVFVTLTFITAFAAIPV